MMLPPDHDDRTASPGSAGLPAASTPGRLLVVDDERFLRNAVAASLRFLGFEVTTGRPARRRWACSGSGRSIWWSWT